MNQLNIHKQKLYSLTGGAIAMIALLLPWLTFTMMGITSNQNGIRKWGILSLLGVIGVFYASLNGKKSKDYDASTKKLVLAGFAAIALGALLFYIRKKTAGSRSMMYPNDLFDTGFGLWLCLAVGIAGLLYHTGIIRIGGK